MTTPAQSAEYVVPVHRRRPVRFFAFRIPEDGQIWLDGTAEIIGVEHGPDGWTILVKEEGPVQTDEPDRLADDVRPPHIDGGESDG